MKGEDILVLFVFFCCGFFGTLIGAEIGKEKIRKQALAAGVAEYQVNAKTGEPEFVWLTCEHCVENQEVSE